MWLLDFLPDYALHVALLVGIVISMAGFSLGYIPGIDKYKLPLQILGVLLLIATLYLEGAGAERDAWEMKVKELEAKLAKAEVESAKVNTEIVTQIVTKKQVVKEKGDTIIEYVDRTVESACIVPDTAIKAINAAANNQVDELIETKSINDAAKAPLKLSK